MINPKNDCQHCDPRPVTKNRGQGLGAASGILLFLLPKCPFCFVAFSSSPILCGNASGTSVRNFTSPLNIALVSLFCALSLISTVFRYRELRGRYAILLVSLGSILALCSVSFAGGSGLYYLGVLLVSFGVWLNLGLVSLLGGWVNLAKDRQKTAGR